MFLVGITCVSAENIDDVDKVSIIDADESISADDSIEDTLNVEENEMLSDSQSADVSNWNELDSAVNGDSGADTVNIKANLTPGNQIVINHDVTIVGSADTYIGGSDGSNRPWFNDILFFTNKTGISVTLKNIRFQNCGGNTLIKFAGNGNYILENCTFENITAPNERNVIVHLNWGNLNITGCTFENCQSSYGTVSNFKSDTEPDAVHMIIKGTTFRGNSANVEPGAINNCGQLIVEDSIFEDNWANRWAGAIHTHFNANTTIVRSIFRDNTASWTGGALSTYSYLKVVNSTFIHNEAFSDRGGAAIFGFNQGSSPYIIVENSDFINNTAYSGNGGAIAVISGTLIVKDSRFDNNKAMATNGGAISSGISTTTIANCNFTNNSANNMGGAIFAANIGSLNVTYCNFINNNANEGKDITYYHTGSKPNRAFLVIGYNNFSADGSVAVIVYPNVNVTAYNNTYGNHTPENDTGDVVVIPEDVELLTLYWSNTFNSVDTLTGSPVILEDYVLFPANHTLYCYSIDGDLIWNLTSNWNVTAGAGCFRGLLVDGNVVYAPCSGDKLYILDLATGTSLTNNTILEGSSLYAPVLYEGTLYICSENGYGPNHNLWLTMVKYVDGDYVYYNSTLEINNVTIYEPAILSDPILKGMDLYVNTIYGLISFNLELNTFGYVRSDVIGTPVTGEYDTSFCVLRNNSGSIEISVLDTHLDVQASASVGNCNRLIRDENNNIFTIDDEGYIYYGSYSDNSISCYRTDFHINSVSATIYSDGDYLYIGDDEGILWIFDIGEIYNRGSLSECAIGAFNATYPICGGISVNSVNGIVYFGNTEGDCFVVWM